MAKKKSTREYLEAALEAAKKLLPGWQYAVIHRAALPCSGGRAKQNRRTEVAEKLWIEKTGISQLSNKELKALLYKLNTKFAANKRQDRSNENVLSRTKSVVSEMKKRGLTPEGNCVEACEQSKIKKGFFVGIPEGGMHAHGLKRLQGNTWDDGNHIHLFVIPGSNEVIATWEGGQHEHSLSGEFTAKDGAHTHQVYLDEKGTKLETKLGGEHSHGLMVDTTGFDGPHTHELVMPDGTVVKSLTVQEFIDKFIDIKTLVTGPIWEASQIANSLNTIQNLYDVINELEFDISQANAMDVALEAFANDQPIEPPMLVGEVMDVIDGEVLFVFDELDNVFKADTGDFVGIDAGDTVGVCPLEMNIVAINPSVTPHNKDEVLKIADFCEEYKRLTKTVPFSGPDEPKIVFVAAQPNPIELVRGEALVGMDGAVFVEKYLNPLGLNRSDVATGFAIPATGEQSSDLWNAKLHRELDSYPNKPLIVALGRVAKEAVGDRADLVLPHPAALRRHVDQGEVRRKLIKFSKRLDNKTKIGNDTNDSSSSAIQAGAKIKIADSISGRGASKDLLVGVSKSADEKQIVYGVILDPYQVDLHNDWIPPAEIEATAHDFMKNSRMVGLEHKGEANATVVESWIESYPTKKDRTNAFENLPHSVNRRDFGDDKIHSGAWLLGVHLDDTLWEAHKKGELNAFSIGGFSFKTKITEDAMPAIEYIDK